MSFGPEWFVVLGLVVITALIVVLFRTLIRLGRKS
jgi:hypothetical protein